MVVAAYAGPASCEFRPDIDTAWLWLSWWFEFCTRGMIEIGWMNPASGQLTQFRRFERGDISILKCIDDENRVPGQSMYVRAGTVDPESPVGRTRDEHILQAPGPWADLDTQEQVERARRVESLVRANGWTTTGMFPHVRYQLWVRASEPMIDVDNIRHVNRQMQKLYGGDPSVANPSRLMRLPGTIAWPYKTGRIVELTKFELAPSDRPRQYPMSTIRAMLPQLASEASEQQKAINLDDEWGGPVAGSPGGLSLIATAIADIRAGRQWHNGVVRLVASWIGRGWSNAEILLACEGLTLPGWTVGQTREEVAKAIEGARRKWNVPEPSGDSLLGIAAARQFPASDVSWDAMLSISPREWIYGHFLIKGFVSVLAAPGGTGKTAYAVAVALAIALNKSLLGETVHQSGKVWLCNLEDPLDEVLRRLRAATLHHQIGREIEGLLFVDSGRDREMTIATLDNGTVVVTPLVEMLVAEIKRRGITVLIVDPFIRSHRVLENANEHIDMVMTLWARVAQEAHCCVWLLYHFRKGGTPGEAASFRGATALIDAARAAIALTRMSEDEADTLGIQDEQRWRYIRVDNAKLNLAPPPDVALWLKLVGVDLMNETTDLPADNVQTVERWTPTSAWEGMPWSMVIRILETIEAGPEPGEYFSASPRANERWAGKVIIADAARTNSQAQKILKSWLKSGVLIEGEYHSAAIRHTTGCVRVDNVKLQEMRREAVGKPDVWDD